MLSRRFKARLKTFSAACGSSASGLGKRAHESLLLTLKTLEAKIGEDSALLIFHARTKVNAEGEINDAATLEALKSLIESFIQTIDENN